MAKHIQEAQDADNLEAVFKVVEEALASKSFEVRQAAVGKIETFNYARAIRELAKLANDGGMASKAAKESYENVTGEPFENWAAAELKAMAIDRENASSASASAAEVK